jgi:hypothetical protein
LFVKIPATNKQTAKKTKKVMDERKGAKRVSWLAYWLTCWLLCFLLSWGFLLVCCWPCLRPRQRIIVCRFIHYRV